MASWAMEAPVFLGDSGKARLVHHFIPAPWWHPHTQRETVSTCLWGYGAPQDGHSAAGQGTLGNKAIFRLGTGQDFLLFLL